MLTLKSGFFKTKSHKRFNLYTRYYDADKEQLKERIKAAEEKLKDRQDYNREGIARRISFESQTKQSWNSASRQTMMANLRLLGILIALCVACYWIFIRVDGMAEILVK